MTEDDESRFNTYWKKTTENEENDFNEESSISSESSLLEEELGEDLEDNGTDEEDVSEQ